MTRRPHSGSMAQRIAWLVTRSELLPVPPWRAGDVPFGTPEVPVAEAKSQDELLSTAQDRVLELTRTGMLPYFEEYFAHRVVLAPLGGRGNAGAIRRVEGEGPMRLRLPRVEAADESRIEQGGGAWSSEAGGKPPWGWGRVIIRDEVNIGGFKVGRRRLGPARKWVLAHEDDANLSGGAAFPFLRDAVRAAAVLPPGRYKVVEITGGARPVQTGAVEHIWVQP